MGASGRQAAAPSAALAAALAARRQGVNCPLPRAQGSDAAWHKRTASLAHVLTAPGSRERARWRSVAALSHARSSISSPTQHACFRERQMLFCCKASCGSASPLQTIELAANNDNQTRMRELLWVRAQGALSMHAGSALAAAATAGGAGGAGRSASVHCSYTMLSMHAEMQHSGRSVHDQVLALQAGRCTACTAYKLHDIRTGLEPVKTVAPTGTVHYSRHDILGTVSSYLICGTLTMTAEAAALAVRQLSQDLPFSRRRRLRKQSRQAEQASRAGTTRSSCVPTLCRTIARQLPVACGCQAAPHQPRHRFAFRPSPPRTSAPHQPAEAAPRNGMRREELGSAAWGLSSLPCSPPLAAATRPRRRRPTLLHLRSLPNNSTG